MLEGTEGEAYETGENTDHTEDFAPRVGFVQEKKSVGEADDRSASTDGADDGNHGVEVTESEHVNVVGDYQKHGDHRDDSDVFNRFMIYDFKFMIFQFFDQPDDEHHRGLVEGVIDLNGIMVVTAHKVFVIEAGAGTDQNR